MKDKEIFPSKYRVRPGLFGKSVLQVLVGVKRTDITGEEYGSVLHYKWVDVKYDLAPRALRSEIND